MAKITLHSDKENTATSVSNVFIDEYMSNANGEFVKIYLYLLRCMNSSDAAFSISAMADKFEHTEKDIKRALNYWERMHLLRLEYDADRNLTGVCFTDSDSVSKPTATKQPAVIPVETSGKTAEVAGKVQTSQSANKATIDASPSISAADAITDAVAPKATAEASLTEATSSVAPVAKVPDRKQYTADQIKNFQKNEDIAELFFITERYLGRPLTSTDTNSILYWNDGLGFSVDLIEYLVEYCVSKKHTNIRYMDKVALAWAESKITTVEEAKQSSNLHSQLYFAVLKAFGITGRNLVDSETAYIDKWKNTYGFSQDIILEGCKRTMQAIHQPSFEYTDRILSSWNKAKICTMEDIAKADEAFQKKKASTPANANNNSTSSKNKFNNFNQRSYDYDQLEKMLLTTNVH